MPNLLSIFGLSIFTYNNNNNNNRYCSKKIKVPILGGRAERTTRKICPLEMEQNKEFTSFSKDEGWCKPKILRLNNMSLRHKELGLGCSVSRVPAEQPGSLQFGCFTPTLKTDILTSATLVPGRPGSGLGVWYPAVEPINKLPVSKRGGEKLRKMSNLDFRPPYMCTHMYT